MTDVMCGVHNNWVAMIGIKLSNVGVTNSIS
jgi:hypothetical protein